MISSEALGRLKKLAAEVSEREGVQLYDIEFVGRGGHRSLRVYVDNPTHTVSVDDCANVSRGLSLLLDVEDLIPGTAYDLEVSTPGLDRVLKEDWHFESAVNQVIRVHTQSAIPGTEDRKVPLKKLKARLKAFENQELCLESDEGSWRVPMGIIHRAHVVYEFETPKKPRGKRNGS